MIYHFKVYIEHNPIEKLESHLLKMKKLTNKYMYISLPFSGRWNQVFNLRGRFFLTYSLKLLFKKHL